MNTERYEVCIIGGGPAAVGAAVYAARKKIRAVLVAESFGGQSVVSNEIQNWIGETGISGFDLAQRLERHVRAQQGLVVKSAVRVTKVEKDGDGFSCTGSDGTTIRTRYLLVATGSRRRRLGIPGEDEFDGKGVAFCGTCDAPLFQGKAVAVIGGGNSGLETVLDLVPYATKIYLLHRGAALKGDTVTQEKIARHPSVEVVLEAVPVSIAGSEFVTGLTYRAGGPPVSLAVGGVFVEIGSVPNSELVADLVLRNSWGEIVTDRRTQRTSVPGIWAAGDVTDGLYRQNNISVGDGITALLNINDALHAVERPPQDRRGLAAGGVE